MLPSYGRGRDAPGGRFSSLIFGTNLTDVVITGNHLHKQRLLSSSQILCQVISELDFFKIGN